MNDGAMPPGVEARRMRVRVYWEDTDASGIVYHTAYLRWAERARTELLRSFGFDQSRLLSEIGVAFAVRRCDIDFLLPARLDDLLDVETEVAEVGGASIRLAQRIGRSGDALARLLLRLACLDREGRPVRVPAAVRAAFERARHAASTAPEPGA